MIEFPWVGFELEILGTNVEGNREWWTAGVSRISGFTRMSAHIAIIIMVSSIYLLYGYRNNYILESLKEKLSINFILEKDLSINFDYIEAELIAYLAARSLYKMPITFPSTTGASLASSGGIIFDPL